MNEPFVRVADVTRGVASRYGQLLPTLRRAGTPIAVNDIWIASTAVDVGGTLLTFDRDFQRIPSLRCIVLDPLSLAEPLPPIG